MSCPRCCHIWALRCRSSSCTSGRLRLRFCWTMAMEDIVSAAATTTTAPVRITRHTAGPTPAPTEWRADSICRRAAFAILNGPPGELAYNRTLALPGEPPAQLTRHHSADVQQPRTDQRPIVFHQPKLLRT